MTVRHYPKHPRTRATRFYLIQKWRDGCTTRQLIGKLLGPGLQMTINQANGGISEAVDDDVCTVVVIFDKSMPSLLQILNLPYCLTTIADDAPSQCLLTPSDPDYSIYCRANLFCFFHWLCPQERPSRLRRKFLPLHP
jgi:hypothetical protein